MAGARTVTATTTFVALDDGAYVTVQEGDEYKSTDPLVTAGFEALTAKPSGSVRTP